MKIYRIILFGLLLIGCYKLSIAQDIIVKQDKEELFYTFAPRLGVGVHNYMNFDIGISALYVSNKGLQWEAISAYSSLIFQQTDWGSGFNSKGFRLGIQSSWAIFMWGLEWKTLNYNGSNYNYLSPKIGLSWLDVVNIEYLINVLDMNEGIPVNSRHQLSVNISLNKKIYNNIWKK